MGYSWNWNFS